MEQRGAKGPRALAAAGAMLVAAFAAACSAAPITESQKPTPLPSESPNQKLTIAPSETSMVTPSPTPEGTPSPTAKPLSTILETELPANSVAITKFEQSIQTAVQENQTVRSIYTNVNQTIQDCEVSSGPGDPAGNRLQACQVLVLNLYKFYSQTRDPIVYEAALNAYQFTLGSNGIGPVYRGELDSYLKKVLGV